MAQRGLRLRNSVRGLMRDRKGATAAILAIAAPALVGYGVLGAEIGLWYDGKLELQTAADAAAISAVMERARGANSAVVSNAGLREAGRNGFTSSATSLASIQSPPTSGALAGNSQAVEVVLRRQQELFLAKMFFSTAPVVRARAVATMSAIGTACVLALDAEASGAVTFIGNTTVTMPSCVIAANSNHAQAINLTGNADLTAKSLYAVGGYAVGGSAEMTLTQAATVNAYALSDPYADIATAVPAGMTCKSGSYKNGAHALTPGRYCDGLTIGSPATVTLSPGVYYIDKGDLDIRGTVSCTCPATGDGVTFVLTSSGAANQIGSVKINAQASVTLRAPSYDGAPFRGLLITQDALAPTGGDNKINGGSILNLTGALHFPRQELEWSGNNVSSTCIEIIARRIKFTGNSAIADVGCTPAGVSQVVIVAPRFAE